MNIFSPFVLWTIKAALIIAAIIFWGAFFVTSGIVLTAISQVAAH